MGYPIVKSCKVTIPIKVKQRGQFLKRQLLANSNGIVPFHSEAMIPLLQMPLPDDQDFLFHPATQTNLTLYIYIVDYEISKILVKNALDWLLCISYYQKLGHIVDIRYNNYFFINTKSTF